MPAKITDPVAWAHTRYAVDDTTGCWIWQGAKYSNGYGNTKFPGNSKRNMVAHRAIYKILHGDIAETLVLDHLCNNRLCVNPSHLQQVTQHENLRRAGTIDRIIKSAKDRSLKEFCTRGHRLSDDNLYRYPGNNNHKQCRICMKINRKNWNGRKSNKTEKETA